MAIDARAVLPEQGQQRYVPMAPPGGGGVGYVSPFSQGYFPAYNPNPNAVPGYQFAPPTYDNPYEFRGLFNDPATVPFMSALTSRVGQLAQPGPQYGEYEATLRRGLSDFMTPLANDPTVAAAMKQLLSGGGAMPGNPYEGQYAKRTNARYDELMQEPFSAGEEAALKVHYFDQIERDHATARQQVLESLAARGLAPSSGPVVEALLQVDQHFDQLRAQAQNQLLTYTTEERQKRHGEALTDSQNLGAFGQNAQQIAAQFRNLMMQSVAQAGELALRQRQMAQDRELAGIGVGGSLAQLQQQRYNQQQQNFDQLLQLSQIPQQMVTQRMGYLGSAMGTPTDIGSGYSSLATGYGNQARNQYTRQQQTSKAIGSGITDISNTYRNRNNPTYDPYGGYTGGGYSYGPRG